MPAIGQRAPASPSLVQKPYAKDDIVTVTTKPKPWFHDEKSAAEVYDEWAVEQWLNSPARKGKYTVAPHKDPDLNALNFDETYPVNAEEYWANPNA